ncbi:MAG: hypothetical protein H6624_20345 [Bdellovibrionaceae bacterium]|nr:hypothetical protein [Pseudobdellovibrionaceae bacterium]
MVTILLGTDEARLSALCQFHQNWAFWRRLNIGQVKGLMSLADRFIGCDSGPMHLAAALDLDVVAIFGPNTSARCGPIMNKGKVVEKEFPCRPCNQNKPCPYDIRCLKSLTAQDVL